MDKMYLFVPFWALTSLLSLVPIQTTHVQYIWIYFISLLLNINYETLQLKMWFINN